MCTIRMLGFSKSRQAIANKQFTFYFVQYVCPFTLHILLTLHSKYYFHDDSIECANQWIFIETMIRELELEWEWEWKSFYMDASNAVRRVNVEFDLVERKIHQLYECESVSCTLVNRCKSSNAARCKLNVYMQVSLLI